MGSPHRTLKMERILVLLLFAAANGAPGTVYPQHLVYNPWFGTYAQPITYYYYSPQSRNVQETVNGRWWQSCSGPAIGSDGNQYCAPKSAVSELPVPTEAQQPGYNISNLMEWPYEQKQEIIQVKDELFPGLKNSVQMDPSLRFDSYMKKLVSLTDLDGNGKLSTEEMFKYPGNTDSIKEIREDIKRFDTNGDHQLSGEESKPFMKEELKKSFSEMDLDGDQVITATEYAESKLGQDNRL